MMKYVISDIKYDAHKSKIEISLELGHMQPVKQHEKRVEL